MVWIWFICRRCPDPDTATCLRFVDGFRNIPWSRGLMANRSTIGRPVLLSFPTGGAN